MYAPFRLPPLDSSIRLNFEKDVRVQEEDLESLTPHLILVRFEGIRASQDDSKVSSYSIRFSGQFGIGDHRDHLTFHENSWAQEPLILEDQTYNFTPPCHIYGHQAQTGPSSIQTLLPQKTFCFLDTHYTLIAFDCIRLDVFDGLYRAPS